MSQAGRTRSARRGEEKIFFSFPRLALRARVSLRAKHRARPARLIKRLSCMLMILRLLEHFGHVICSTFKVSCLFWVETGFKNPQISICKDFGGVLNYRKYRSMFVTQFNCNNSKIINWQLFCVNVLRRPHQYTRGMVFQQNMFYTMKVIKKTIHWMYHFPTWIKLT